MLTAGQAPEAVVRGVQAPDVNLQRGFVTVQSDGRLQVTRGPRPIACNRPNGRASRARLQQDLQAASANFAYRLVDPSFNCR